MPRTNIEKTSYTVLLLSLCVKLFAQTPPSAALYRLPTQVPAVLHDQYAALGDRLQKPGNERLTLTGTLTDSNGSSQVRIVMELGGKLSVSWIDKPTQRIVFTGANVSALGNVLDADDLLEALVDDLPETAMAALASGVGVRVVGQRFPDGSGGLCDYFDVPMFGKTAGKQTPVLKRYCFDSTTSLLRSVRYQGGGTQITATEFANWQTVNGQHIPSTITRLNGSARVFQFNAQSVIASRSVPDSAFAP